ncbi:MAG: carboxymuconolactone decarboxylase family protein [Marinobacter sp.]|uniref:carboxymuconolactone decarboxylase family protein n=1 Tax=Marinobacter sp. TaxID=50741 RepID=UPI00299EB627|nr:carboxymuconolactone decarboxylase family protein [Marinobacter sp.]MDX1757426.1 carboxymuconolactone decarboxylase family protein [Marinobacter sp.]
MTTRPDPATAAPAAYQAMFGLETYLGRCGLEPSLRELVKIRASQINGCAFCLHMHTRDARAHGETEDRLNLLAAWRESSLYSERERAALAWTETMTRVAHRHPGDDDYRSLDEHFTAEEQVNLTLLIGTINSWNRLAIGFHKAHPTADPAIPASA